MQWMVKLFQWKAEQWWRRLGDVTNEERPPGLDSYCHKQIVMWDTLGNWMASQLSVLLGRPLFA